MDHEKAANDGPDNQDAPGERAVDRMDRPENLGAPVERAVDRRGGPENLGAPVVRAEGRKDRLEILGVPVDHVTADEAVERIADVIRTGGKAHVVTVNPEFVMAARRDPLFMAVLRDAQLALADGVGMVWASRLLRRPLPERVAGVDVLPRIAIAAAEMGGSVFLLGAAPGVADRAATALVNLDGEQAVPRRGRFDSGAPRAAEVGSDAAPIQRAPDRDVQSEGQEVHGQSETPDVHVQSQSSGVHVQSQSSGVHVQSQSSGVHVQSQIPLVAGAFSGSPSDEEAESIVRLVNESGAAVLFVAFGAPAQDVWIARHRDDLGTHVMMGVGGAFDFLAGERRRAPERVRRVGLEWLWRLAAEPWRWRRQLALPRFAAAVALDSLRRRP